MSAKATVELSLLDPHTVPRLSLKPQSTVSRLLVWLTSEFDSSTGISSRRSAFGKSLDVPRLSSC